MIAILLLAVIVVLPPEGRSHANNQAQPPANDQAQPPANDQAQPPANNQAQPPANNQAQPPARDTRPVVAGPPAAIAGIVVSDEGQPRPLRRARVTITGPTLQIPRTAITKDDGTFEFGGLPAGRYTLTAQKEAYVTMAHGAARPARPGRPVLLKPGERRTLTVVLPRGAVITGTIADADGQPAQGVQVSAFTRRLLTPMGDRRLATAGMSPTDDRGVYRIYGLAAGEYVVSAQSPQRAAGSPVGEVRTISAAGPSARGVTHTPVFFPGATDVARASRVTVAAGEERAGIDMQLQYVPLAVVGGSIQVGPGLHPSVTLARLAEVVGAPATQVAHPDPEGRFIFRNVPPGQYLLAARAVPSSPAPPAGSGPAPVAQWLTAEVTVDGEDVLNVALSNQPLVTIAGRLAFEGARPAPDLAGTRLPFIPAGQTIGNFQTTLPQIQLAPAGRFVISGILPGLYRLGALPAQSMQGIRAPIGGWWLKSIVVDGRDILGAPLDIRQSADDAVATFTDQVSEISGTVKDAQGAAASDLFVVVFSADRGAWFFNSRRVTAVRVDPEGRFTVRNLPPGEYRAIATADLEQNEWFEPAVLDRLAPTATPIAIAGVEKKTMELVVR